MEDEYVPLTVGSASAAADDRQDAAPAYPVATLWLPDPGTPSGWSMRHVWRPEPPRPERRPISFRTR